MRATQKQTKLKQLRRRETAFEILFVAPQFTLFVLLTIVPFFIALPISLTDQATALDREINYVGLQNFIRVFTAPVNADFFPVVGRTVIFILLNYAMVWLFGFTLALVLYEVPSVGQKGFFSIIYMPYVVSGLGIGMILSMLFSRDTGSMNLLLLKLNIIDEAINIKEPAVARIVVPLLMGWRFAGFNAALFLNGLLSIPPETIDCAEVDGANYIQRLVHVYWPQMIPAIMTATIFCLIGTWGVFDELIGMGALHGNEQIRMFSILVFQKGFNREGSMSLGITMSLIVYIPMLVLANLLIAWQRKQQY